MTDHEKYIFAELVKAVDLIDDIDRRLLDLRLRVNEAKNALHGKDDE